MIRHVTIAAVAAALDASAASALPANMFGGEKKVIEPMTEAPLTATGPQHVQAGRIASGAAFVSQGVRHTVTGVLTSEVKPRGLVAMTSKTLPAGTPVYAVPMNYGLTWCAPHKERPGYWTAACLPHDEYGGRRFVRSMLVTPALFVTALALDRAGYTNDPVVVERRPVDFGVAMELAYRFVGWGRKDADVHVMLVAGDTSFTVERLNVPREADGSVVIQALGGVFRLLPIEGDKKAATVEVIRHPTGQEAIAL